MDTVSAEMYNGRIKGYNWDTGRYNTAPDPRASDDKGMSHEYRLYGPSTDSHGSFYTSYDITWVAHSPQK